MFTYCLLELDAAYSKPFLGKTATNFVDFLVETDNDIQRGNLEIYAKAISIVQSSGTGKSRLLTEVRLYSIRRQYSTLYLLGWQTHIHAPHLSPPSIRTRLPAIRQRSASLFYGDRARVRQRHKSYCTHRYCVFPCSSTLNHVKVAQGCATTAWL